VKTRAGLTELVWKNKLEAYMLTDMDLWPAEGNVCNNSHCPVKPHIMEWYNQNMGYVNISDHMTNS
jgi:hypothetical protein